MEWLTCLRSALKYIEDNLESDIDVASVSEHVFVSPFYLQKGFQIMTGFSIGEYIRSRRLYEAAMDIAKNDEKIIEVAMRYGYETPESFTKAFTRFHGCTPSAVRRDRVLIHRFLPLKIHIEITGGDKMDWTVSNEKELTVIGFEKVFSAETAQYDVPAFWKEIFQQYFHDGADSPAAKAAAENNVGEFGVCIDDLEDGKFRYMIAGRYKGGVVPEEMKLFTVPGGEWAKFTCTGSMPDAIQSLNNQVFGEWLPGNPEYEAVGCCSVEWYPPEGCTNDADYVGGLWLPVRRYRDEARRLWGETGEYRENAEKTAARTKEENDGVNDGLMRIFEKFGAIKDGDPSSEQAQSLADELRGYISANYYKCGGEVFRGLGLMYSGDSRFKANIDRRGGDGTAEFASKAIEIYCNNL